MTAVAPFDFDAALERTAGDMALLQEIAAMFLADHPTRLAQMDAALAAGDTEAAMYAAHSLKGSAGNFSAPRTFGAAYAVEIAARDGDLEASRVALTVLKLEVGRLSEALTELLAQGAAQNS